MKCIAIGSYGKECRLECCGNICMIDMRRLIKSESLLIRNGGKIKILKNKRFELTRSNGGTERFDKMLPFVVKE